MSNGEGGIRTRGTGLNPYAGLANRCQHDVTSNNDNDLDNSPAQCRTDCRTTDAEFALVSAAWPTLPQPIRKAILAIVRDAGG